MTPPVYRVNGIDPSDPEGLGAFLAHRPPQAALAQAHRRIAALESDVDALWRIVQDISDEGAGLLPAVPVDIVHHANGTISSPWGVDEQ